MSQDVKVSLTALADQAGVSVATVSRVLNNKNGIAARTRQRVLEAARENGYRPRVASRPVTVALVIDQAHESRTTGGGFVEALTMAVLESLTHHQFVVETFTSGNIKRLAGRFVDGVLAIAWRAETLEELRRLSGVPVAIFNRPECSEFSNIQIDDRRIGQLAASHLLDHGHERLAVVAEQLDPETQARIDGFSQTLAEAGLKLADSAVSLTRFMPPLSTVQRLCRSGITGLFVLNEHLSMEIPFLCARALQIRVPDELSIVGVGVEAAMRYHNPPMTLVAPPVGEMARLALDLLNDVIARRSCEPRSVVLQPRLVARDSVAAPA